MHTLKLQQLGDTQRYRGEVDQPCRCVDDGRQMVRIWLGRGGREQSGCGVDINY